MSTLSRLRWTFCCVWSVEGIALLMVNIPCARGKTTAALVAYDDLHPVVIRELS